MNERKNRGFTSLTSLLTRFAGVTRGFAGVMESYCGSVLGFSRKA